MHFCCLQPGHSLRTDGKQQTGQSKCGKQQHLGGRPGLKKCGKQHLFRRIKEPLAGRQGAENNSQLQDCGLLPPSQPAFQAAHGLPTCSRASMPHAFACPIMSSPTACNTEALLAATSLAAHCKNVKKSATSCKPSNRRQRRSRVRSQWQQQHHHHHLSRRQQPC